MRYIIHFVILCLLTVIYQGCATYPETATPSPQVSVSPLFSSGVYDRIAVYVLDRTHSFRHTGALRQVEDEFMRAVIEKGYTLATRSDIEQLLKELDLQASNITEEALAKKAKMLNVSAVLLVSVNELSMSEYNPTIEPFVNAVFNVRGKRYYAASANISARLISAELAQVVWISSFSGRYRVDDPRQEQKALVPVARIVASGLPTCSRNH